MVAPARIIGKLAERRLHAGRGPAAIALAVAAAAFMVNADNARAAALASGPLPTITPEARASELVQPATVFVQVNWDAQVTVLSAGGYEEQPVAGVYREKWVIGCTGFVVNPDGYIVTAGHCLDDGRDGAEHNATEMVVDDLIQQGKLSPVYRDALIDAVDVGNVRWKVEGTLADSRPDREVHVSVGGGKAAWNGASDAVPGVNARVLDVKPWSQGDVGMLKIEDSDLPVAVLATKSDIQVGDQILAVGYPLALAESGQDVKIALTNRSGQINSVDTQGEHGPGNLFYETSAAF
jgi:S1-C subfamily serine protease